MKEHTFTKITKVFLFAMLFSPLISYFVLIGTAGDRSSTYYFSAYSIILGSIYLVLFADKIKLPKELIFLILYIIYEISWTFFNGEYERRGLFNQLINNLHIGTFFIILIIYNIHFSDKFINNTSKIFKLTVVLAVFASIYQVFNNSFLDANPFWQKSNVSDIIGDIYQDRRLSIFGFVNLNELGLSFLPFASAMIGYYLYYRKEGNSPIFAIFVGIISLLSNNRYVIVGFILLLIQFYIIKKDNTSNILKNIFIIVIGSISLYIILNLVGYNFDEWFSNRLFKEGSITNTTRFGALQNFIYFFPEVLLFGTGVHLTAQIALASHSIGSSQIHVGYLSHLLTYGLLGSFLLFGFWFMLLKRLYKNAKKTKYWGAFFGVLIFMWAQATLVYYFIFFYGIIYCLIMDKYMGDSISKNKI